MAPSTPRRDTPEFIVNLSFQFVKSGFKPLQLGFIFSQIVPNELQHFNAARFVDCPPMVFVGGKPWCYRKIGPSTRCAVYVMPPAQTRAPVSQPRPARICRFPKVAQFYGRAGSLGGAKTARQ